MSERSYCRFVLFYLLWMVVLSYFGVGPPAGENSDAFLWRAHIALYPTVITWFVIVIAKGAFRRR